MMNICAALIWPVLGLKLAVDEPLVCTMMLKAGLASGLHLQLAQELPDYICITAVPLTTRQGHASLA